MSHDRYQHRHFEHIDDHEAGGTVSYGTAPSGISLDTFWALVDPDDSPDPRDA